MAWEAGDHLGPACERLDYMDNPGRVYEARREVTEILVEENFSPGYFVSNSTKKTNITCQ